MTRTASTRPVIGSGSPSLEGSTRSTAAAQPRSRSGKPLRPPTRASTELRVSSTSRVTAGMYGCRTAKTLRSSTRRAATCFARCGSRTAKGYPPSLTCYGLRYSGGELVAIRNPDQSVGTVDLTSRSYTPIATNPSINTQQSGTSANWAAGFGSYWLGSSTVDTKTGQQVNNLTRPRSNERRGHGQDSQRCGLLQPRRRPGTAASGGSGRSGVTVSYAAMVRLRRSGPRRPEDRRDHRHDSASSHPLLPQRVGRQRRRRRSQPRLDRTRVSLARARGAGWVRRTTVGHGWTFGLVALMYLDSYVTVLVHSTPWRLFCAHWRTRAGERCWRP